MTTSPDRLLQGTAALLVASVALVGPSLLGLGGSLPLAGVLAVLAGGLFAVRDRLAALGSGDLALGGYLSVAWAGAAVAALLVLVFPGASAGEVQALGGLCGLVGMINYFLRPLYGLALAAGRSLDRRLG